MVWAIVMNPYSGKRNGLNLAHEFKEAALTKNIQCLDICGTSAGDSIAQLKDAIANANIEAVVVVGGDGLINNVIQVLAETNIPLAVLAAGTGNDFARTSGTFQLNPQQLCEFMCLEKPKAIDLGRVSTQNSVKWFGQILSTGFDSVVNERANQFTRLKGKMKYNVATVMKLPRFNPVQYNIVADGREISTKAMLVAVANGPTYGGGMKVCPHADRHDGMFDILILRPLPKLEFIAVFPKVFKGTHITHSQVEIFRAKELTIRANAKVYADGEDFGDLPINVETVGSSLLTWVK